MQDVSEKIQRLIRCEHYDPFEVLGPHPVPAKEGGANALAIRVFEPGAREVHVLDAKTGKPRAAMNRAYAPDVFECVLPKPAEPFAYQLKAVYDGGAEGSGATPTPTAAS
jgi:1,4-alpha-glucan branching enzyme